MKGSGIIFYLLGFMSLVSGFLAVTTRKIFRAAIYLLFSLIGIAGIYFWLQYEFIAAVQIIVYVGGIVVLIIFSIFLTQQSGEKLSSPSAGKMILSAFAALFGFALVALQIFSYEFKSSDQQRIEPTVANIGSQMLDTKTTGYALPFEVVSILLLAAMIACIVIAMRIPKQQNAL